MKNRTLDKIDDCINDISSCVDTIEDAAEDSETQDECKDISNHLDKIERLLKEAQNEFDEFDEEIYSLQSKADTSFTATETISYNAPNFKDREVMEALQACFERNITAQIIINTLSAI